MCSSIRSVTVYCSSSCIVAPVYLSAARELGDLIARAGWDLVYGGNNLGSMGALAQAAREAGGKVIGVTPQSLVDDGSADEKCDELLVTSGMRERKALLEARGDGFIALPGGLGTLEELFEILVGKFLGYHAKPVVLLNIENFFAPLLSMIDHAVELGFMKPRVRQLFHVCHTPLEAVNWLGHLHSTGEKAANLSPANRID